jgi:hypothetical protein
MKIFRIDHEASLGAALREHGVLQYQIGILIKYGAVLVSRSNGIIPSSLDERTHLKAGDLVSIEDPLPEKCQAELADMEFGDYAFVPGKSLYEKSLAATLGLRPKTVVLEASSLKSFIEGLAKSTRLTRPIRALIIGAHASSWGGLDIPIDMETEDNNIGYEDLIDARDKGSIKVPSDLRPRDKSGKPIPVAVHVRGCNIGEDTPFLQMLKAALSVDLVTAPRHFHYVAEMTRPAGRMEYMCYNFRICSKTQLKTRDQILHEFAITQFPPRLDGKPVPQESWPKWLPKTVNVREKDKDQSIGVQVISPLTGKREPYGYFRYQPNSLWRVTQKFCCEEDPGTPEKRRTLVRDFLEKDPKFSQDYGSPVYKRYGCQSLADFMNAWEWQIDWIEADKVLQVQATRHEYIMEPPVTDPKTGSVFLNFYPTRDPRTPDIEPKPLIQMTEDDDRFFGRA